MARAAQKTRHGLDLAQMLGWFSIGLGVAEMLGARPMTRALGMRGQSGTFRAYGVREFATGVAILTRPDPTPWIWGRIAGDALDLATLATGLDPRNRRRDKVVGALAAVAGVTALDLLCARELSKPTTNRWVGEYRSRSGMGHSRTREKYETPRDFAVPQALAPWDA